MENSVRKDDGITRFVQINNAYFFRFSQLAKMDSAFEFKSMDKNKDGYVTWAELCQERFKKSPEELTKEMKDGTMKKLDILVSDFLSALMFINYH